MLAIIEEQLHADNMKHFLIFLAREHQRGKVSMSLSYTKDIINSLTSTDLIQVLTQVLTSKRAQIFLV
ncbi:hypothetical protein CAC02_03915 [Streptococcus gallolyticus]|uniref:Uncharacterized protein n=1 Tax=Streptococcus gallolyticus TaxID=315405 RepID=A0A368UEB7_9STRE|nr:hypothetical protein CAC02_03915 [Streptococcus gallolyticus]